MLVCVHLLLFVIDIHSNFQCLCLYVLVIYSIEFLFQWSFRFYIALVQHEMLQVGCLVVFQCCSVDFSVLLFLSFSFFVVCLSGFYLLILISYRLIYFSCIYWLLFKLCGFVVIRVVLGIPSSGCYLGGCNCYLCEFYSGAYSYRGLVCCILVPCLGLLFLVWNSFFLSGSWCVFGQCCYLLSGIWCAGRCSVDSWVWFHTLKCLSTGWLFIDIGFSACFYSSSSTIWSLVLLLFSCGLRR